MFTGIITDIGTIERSEQRGDLRLRIACGSDMDGVALGASIACSGVCLTVVDKGVGDSGDGWFDVDASGEISDSGHVNVRVAYREDVVNVSGAVSGDAA